MAAGSKIDLSKFRNIGIIAHIDAGKTTTTDHVLYYAGAKHKLGYVDSGTTDTDYDPEEQERGITIYSACVPFTWRDCTVNLIDTPGHVDFTAEVERSLRVLDGCVVVFDAQKGVEAQSETVWRQADKYQVPRLVFVNKMDVVGANFPNALEEIKERLEGRPLALSIPIGSGSPKDSHTPFAGIVDLIAMKALYFDAKNDGKTIRVEAIPEGLQVDAEHYREQMLNVLSEKSDELANAVLAQMDTGVDIPAETIRTAIREQTIKRIIQPVLCGSGREHIGVQPLMDAVTFYLPSPLDRPPVVGTNPKKPDKEEKRKPDPKEPFCALVFKVVSDKHGDRFFLRVYSGTLKNQSRVHNPGRDFKELVSKIYHVHADPRRLPEDIPEAVAGDIVALVGLRESITGDTLCDAQHPILLEPIHFAEAVVSQAIEPQSTADKDKLIATLDSLRREDPTFTYGENKDTGQLLMSGMGVLHLEIKKHRMERDFNLKVRVYPPRVSYRETIRRQTRAEGECVRQNATGTAGMFAKLSIQLEPHKNEQQPIVVVNKVPEQVLPPSLAAAAERGIRGALMSGDLGYPVINVKATMMSAQTDPQLSSEVAFEAAASDAVNQAIKENIVLLEPVMRLEVTVPEDYMGAVNADLNARRAEIGDVVARGKLRVIEATVPLARMFDYSEKVRSLTQGRASWTMEPSAYAPAPDEVLRKLLHPDEDY
ncbi:MAG: elongation factor G [Gemmataceae bacterium]|nr:elongation factor G [Gemmataceae bacterium]